MDKLDNSVPQIAESRTAVNAADSRITRVLANRFKREMVSQVHLRVRRQV